MRKRLPEPLSASSFGDNLGSARPSVREAYVDTVHQPNQGTVVGNSRLPRRLPVKLPDYHATLAENIAFPEDGHYERIPAYEQRSLSRSSSMPPENRMPTSMLRLPSVPDVKTPYFPSMLSLPMAPATLPPDPLLLGSSPYGASLVASSPSDMPPPLPPPSPVLQARIDAIQSVLSARDCRTGMDSFRKKYDEERRLEELERQQKVLIENQFLLRDLQITRWETGDTEPRNELIGANGFHNGLGQKIQDLEQRYYDALQANNCLQQELQKLDVERLKADMQKLQETHKSELNNIRSDHEKKQREAESIAENARRDFQRLQVDLDAERSARKKSEGKMEAMFNDALRLRADLEVAEEAREEHSLANKALREEVENLRANLDRELQSGQNLLQQVRGTEEENHRLREDLAFWKDRCNDADVSRKSSKMLDESKRKESLVALESVLNDLDEVSADLDDGKLTKLRTALQQQLAELSHLEFRSNHEYEADDDSPRSRRLSRKRSSTRSNLQKSSVQNPRDFEEDAKQILDRLKLVEEERNQAMQDVKILRSANDELRQGLREKMSLFVPSASGAPLGNASSHPSFANDGQSIEQIVEAESQLLRRSLEPTVEADLSMDGVTSDSGSIWDANLTGSEDAFVISRRSNVPSLSL